MKKADRPLLKCIDVSHGSKFTQLLAHKSLVNMGRHLQGLGVLFQYYGIERIESVEVKGLLYALRTLEVTDSLGV